METLKGKLSILFLLCTTSLFAQDFDTFDTNDDGLWDENEFNETYSDEYYSDWDQDSDGFVDEAEFGATTFDNVDEDEDGYINDEEWQGGSEAMYGDYADEDDFGSFDTNDDDVLDENEWNYGFSDAGWYDTYDSDQSGTVDDDELTDGVFDDWDADDDGYLNEQEYQDSETYFVIR